MDDDYEDLRVEFTLLPGVDLRLWTTILLAVLVLTGLAVALAVTAS
jgi:hypothetical protein